MNEGCCHKKNRNALEELLGIYKKMGIHHKQNFLI